MITEISLTEYSKRVTIVASTKITFLSQKIHEFPTKIVHFRYFFEVENISNSPNYSRQYSVKICSYDKLPKTQLVTIFFVNTK